MNSCKNGYERVKEKCLKKCKDGYKRNLVTNRCKKLDAMEIYKEKQKLFKRVLENDSIWMYKGSYYSKINKSLIKNKGVVKKKYAKMIDDIDSAMKTGKETLTVYRGLKGMSNMCFKKIDKKNYVSQAKKWCVKDDVIFNPQYCSVTTDIKVAQQFIGNDNCCILVISLPVKIKRVNVESYIQKVTKSDFYTDIEKELILERNTRIKLTGNYKTIKGIKYYEAKIRRYDPQLYELN